MTDAPPVVVAGSRDLYRPDLAALALHAFVLEHGMVGEIVSGWAAGMDKAGEAVAERWGLPIKFFPAEWGKYGKASGPIRNRAMASYVQERGGGVIVIHNGSRGSLDMLRQALMAGVPTLNWDVRGIPPEELD